MSLLVVGLVVFGFGLGPDDCLDFLDDLDDVWRVGLGPDDDGLDFSDDSGEVTDEVGFAAGLGGTKEQRRFAEWRIGGEGGD